jgi:hypothetical protein
MKPFFVLLLLVGTAVAGLGADRSPILLQSQESRTRQNGPVFNRIAWTPGWDRDVWVMQQSHVGLSPAYSSWDRLAIVVDKMQTPKVARFYQLEPGASGWNENAKPAPLRATCFQCHSNGPRAIRPEPGASAVTIGIADRARLLLWNARIKTYGRIAMDSAQIAERASEKTPLRYPGAFENEKLAVATCIRCHSENSWIRGPLTRQNFMSIGFMVGKGLMPPPGFTLSEGEKKALTRFIQGFPI